MFYFIPPGLFCLSYPNLAPQDVQNLEPGGVTAPHWGQNFFLSARGVPHSVQNLEPSAIVALHLVQRFCADAEEFRVPPITLFAISFNRESITFSPPLPFAKAAEPLFFAALERMS